MAKKKERLDRLLVLRGLVETRTKAQALIMAGEVRVNGQISSKPGMPVQVEARVELIQALPYVSKGGYKLAAALDAFELDVQGRICADVGACTGGFTDVLLQRGATRVYALDVGYGQLDWKLRRDARVVVMERTNARYVERLKEPISVACVDVSFISLEIILDAVRQWLAPEPDVIALIKPQFEAGRGKVGKGGIVRDAAVHREVLHTILNAASAMHLWPSGLIRSPLAGATKNTEFLGWFRPHFNPEFDISSSVEQVLS